MSTEEEHLERRADDLVPTGVARRYLVRAKDATDVLERASLAALADAAAQLATAEELAELVKATDRQTKALEAIGGLVETKVVPALEGPLRGGSR